MYINREQLLGKKLPEKKLLMTNFSFFLKKKWFATNLTNLKGSNENTKRFVNNPLHPIGEETSNWSQIWLEY